MLLHITDNSILEREAQIKLTKAKTLSGIQIWGQRMRKCALRNIKANTSQTFVLVGVVIVVAGLDHHVKMLG